MARVNLIICIQAIALLICSTGLLYQLEQISVRYFKFETRSDIELLIPDSITIPITSACWYLKDVMKSVKGMDVYEFYDKFDQMTIEDIFKDSPMVENIFVEDRACAIRLPNRIINKYPNRTTCQKIFEIKRYIQRNFMCYKFHVTEVDPNRKLEMTEYSLSPTMSGMIYRIVLQANPFGNVIYFTAFAHTSLSSDLHDSMFSQSVFHYRDNSSTYTYIQMKMTFSGLSIYRLKPPYDTACQLYAPYETGAEFYYEKLQKETVSKLGRVHTFYPIFNQTLKQKMISSKIFMNDTFLREFNDIYKLYNKTVSDCNLEYLVSKYTLSFGPEVTIDVYWPQDSNIGMKSVPAYDLIDYLLYVCSSFGIWLGVSVLTIGEGLITLIKRFKQIEESKSRKHSCIKSDLVRRRFEILERSHRRIHRSFIALLEYTKIQRGVIRNEVRQEILSIRNLQ